MTQGEWDQLWWSEFLRLRKLDPTQDLLATHAKAGKNTAQKYGPRPPKAEPGPPWWIKLVALALEVPMSFLQKIWDWLNGKKTVVGLIITVAATIAGYLPVVLAFLGVNAVLVAKIVGIATTVLGVLHKIYKWIYKEEHP